MNAKSCRAIAKPGASIIGTSAVSTRITTVRRGRRPAVGHLKWIMACPHFLESFEDADGGAPASPSGGRAERTCRPRRRSAHLGSVLVIRRYRMPTMREAVAYSELGMPQNDF